LGEGHGHAAPPDRRARKVPSRVDPAPPLNVPDGFTVEFAAKPPLVHHPMMACLDDRGRLFIAESDGVNRKAAELLAERPHSILLLEDTDHDGQFDTRAVFARDLVLPNGTQWYNNALYVCSAPYLWKFEDTDDDGQADRQTALVGTFNFNGMSSAFHGPVLGPDGRLYWSGGQHGWRLERPDPLPKRHDKLEKSVHGQLGVPGPWTTTAPGVFSCWPDGSDAENLAFGGICNPVETTFSATGEVFGTVAVYDNYQNARRDAVVHWIDGGVFNLAQQNYVGRRRTGADLTPLSYRGQVAPSGITRYRSGVFGEGYRGNLFFVEFNTQKVYRLSVERDGATFRSHSQVFLSTSSPDSHFTDVLEDADGSLLVVDTGGWFRYGCPTSQIAKPNLLGAIYRIRKTNTSPDNDPRGTKIDWPARSNGDLAARLDDGRFAVRDRAIAMLAERSPSSISALRGVLEHGSTLAKRNAVWTLTRMGADEAQSAIRIALDDEDFSVRLAATHGVAVLRDEGALPKLQQMLAHDLPAIRREAASALGRIGAPSAVPVLLETATVENDRFLEHAVLLALIRIGDREQIAAALRHPAPQRRRAALIALDQMQDGNLSHDLVVPLLNTDDILLRDTALEVLGRHPEWANEMTERLNALVLVPTPAGAIHPATREVILAYLHEPKVQQLLARKVLSEEHPLQIRLLLLEIMGQVRHNRMPAAWIQPMLFCLRDTDLRLVRQAIASIAIVDTSQFDDELQQIAADADQSGSVRLAAVLILARHGKPLSDTSLEMLIKRCGPQVAAADRLGAARAIGSATLNEQQLLRVTQLISSAGPLELPNLIRAFEGDSSDRVRLSMINALQRAPELAGLSRASFAKLVDGSSDQIRAAAQVLVRNLDAQAATPIERITQLAHTLEGGDRVRGREVFHGRLAGCSACHRVEDKGGSLGPNLSHIGAVRTRRDLLESIVAPSASFARGYEPLTVVTSSGKVVSGVIGRETADTLYLRTLDRAEIRIARDEIEELAPGTVSIMPKGLDTVISRDQIRDLLSYLASLGKDAR